MSAIERHWDRLTPVSLALLPLSLLFCALVLARRLLYRVGVLRSLRISRPVIVVGNITVGGTGKTPLIIWLAEFLRRAGYAPGIVTRGYRGKSPSWPLVVKPTTAAGVAGDEAVLLARRGHCPVVAGPDRVESARQLMKLGCDVILSDDGLQHYRLARDLEIAVIDGTRRFGNGLCLPAGPLREPVTRLETVDLRVANGVALPGEVAMRLEPDEFYSLQRAGTRVGLGHFAGGPVHAVAGIGNPQRFFATLQTLGLAVIPHPFPDHHVFQPGDLEFDDDRPVLLTEKDAVKCGTFAKPNHWVLAVSARPGIEVGEQILQCLKEKIRG